MFGSRSSEFRNLHEFGKTELPHCDGRRDDCPQRLFSAMADTYAIQNAIHAAKTAAGRAIIGWKIGLTSKAMQYALSIDIPDSGILFDDMAFAHSATVPVARFIQPRIEAEITFAMKATLSGRNVTRTNTSPITHRLAQLPHAALAAALLRACGFDSATASPVFRR